MRFPNSLLVICGPTASGKTRLAAELARRFDGEVVSADSMQVYRRMDIGTAKPTPDETAGAPHHLIDILDPGEEFSVADYAALARRAIADIEARGRLPVLAGGTGLYIQAVTENIDFAEAGGDPAMRLELHRMASERGGEYLLGLLREKDPETAAVLHPNNLGRIIRALEVTTKTGIPMSEHVRRSRENPAPWRLCVLGLCFKNRAALYGRIEARVDEMFAGGLIEEAKSLYDEGFSQTAAQAIGYKELFAYFRGEEPLELAITNIKQKTRNYAKRQLTWLRRNPRVRWLEADSFACSEDLLAAAEAVAINEFSQAEGPI